TAARSGTCDQRERGVRHLTAVRCATPKRKERSWLACSPAARAPVASTSLRLPTTQRRANGRRAHGARAAPDRADQSLLLPLGLFPSAGRRVVRDRDRGFWRRFRVPPPRSRKSPGAPRPGCRLGASPAATRSWRRWRRCADRRRGNASRGGGAAKFFSARPARGLFLLCAHGNEAIMSAHGDAEDLKRS